MNGDYPGAWLHARHIEYATHERDAAHERGRDLARRELAEVLTALAATHKGEVYRTALDDVADAHGLTSKSELVVTYRA